MKCIGCNRKLEEGIGHYLTNSGPLCVVCHDNEIKEDELKFKKKFSKIVPSTNHEGPERNKSGIDSYGRK